jgi:hypothetical protein
MMIVSLHACCDVFFRKGLIRSVLHQPIEGPPEVKPDIEGHRIETCTNERIRLPNCIKVASIYI